MTLFINKTLKDYNLDLETVTSIKQLEEFIIFKSHKLTAHSKTRAEVSYSTKKLYKQKGTGRARAGSKKSPLKKGGGVIFGPRNRQHKSFSINRKQYFISILNLFNYLESTNKLTVVDFTQLNSLKTKDAITEIKLSKTKSYVYIQESFTQLNPLENVSNLTILDLKKLNVQKILSADLVFIDSILLDNLQGVLNV